MELSALLPTAQDLPIFNLQGEPTEVIFKVVGKESKRHKEVLNRQPIKAIENPTLGDFDNVEVQLTAACIVGWTGLTENGAPLAYSPEKALEIISTPELGYIRSQVEAFIMDRANFFRGSEPKAAGSRENAGAAKLSKEGRPIKAPFNTEGAGAHGKEQRTSGEQAEVAQAA